MMQNRMTESEEQDAYLERDRYSPYLLADSEENINNDNEEEEEEVLEGEYVCNECNCIPCMCIDEEDKDYESET